MSAVQRATRMLIVGSLVAGLIQGCGGSGSSSSSTSASGAGAGAPTGTSGASASGGAAALTAEAQSAATGDIPDNQMFLRFRNVNSRYSIVYPEGWTRKGDANDVTFIDKNNIIHITISRAAAPTTASVAASLTREQQSKPTLSFSPPKLVALRNGSAVKTTYSTRSAPNSVTGKVVVLNVDRYELGQTGRVATVDLATPTGVDNVDAYRMIINSFRWQ
jgi:hypothetical protein